MLLFARIFEEWMSVAIAAATAILYFSSQVIVHAAGAFEAAFVFTSFRSLLTGQAASAQAYLATMSWHAAAAPAAAVKGFFHHDLLAEPAAASECEVAELIQPAVAASAAAKGNDGCLSDLAIHVFEMVLRLIWSLVVVSGLCGIVDSGYGAVLSSVLRAVLGKRHAVVSLKSSRTENLAGFDPGGAFRCAC